MTGVNWLTPVEMAAWAGLLETFHLLQDLLRGLGGEVG